MKELEERIAEVKVIKRFGEEELGLYFGEMFTEIDLSKSSSFYWLYASYKDRIECPPLKGRRGWSSGCPYNFYYHKSSALRRQKELEKQGFDTHLFGGEGHGGNDCPITRALLEAIPARRASVVLHEAFHNHLDHHTENSGLAVQYSLEEALACYIGDEGTIEYAKRFESNLLPEVEAERDDWLRFAEFLNTHHERLSHCYEQGGEMREAIFQEARKEISQICEEMPESRLWTNLAKNEFNNAFILRMRDYTKDTALVWDVLGQHPVRHYLDNMDEINAYLLECIGEQKD